MDEAVYAARHGFEGQLLVDLLRRLFMFFYETYLDQEHGFVFDFGLHRGGHADLEHAIGSGLRLHPQLDVHRRLLLLQQDGGGIGLLQRGLLEVDALDLENGFLLVGHGLALDR